MSLKIVILLDYKGHFSSKWAAKPYRSGMDLDIIKSEFNKNDFEVEFKHYSDINVRDENYKDHFILYTSSEDINLHYKSYVEDVVYALELQGAKLLPSFKLLKAHHNKVFMEMLRDMSSINSMKNIKSEHYGTLEDFLRNSNNIKYPRIVKGAAGAVSSGVKMITSKVNAKSQIRTISETRSFKNEIWDFIRSLKHKGYKRESKHRLKFVSQNFINGLDRDWKIIVFGDKYFVLERNAKKNDFRASGSGIIKYPETVPDGLFDYAHDIYKEFNVPFFAMDVGHDGEKFILIEFQAVHFGTHTVDTAPYYYKKNGTEWIKYATSVIVEEVLVESVVSYVNASK